MSGRLAEEDKPVSLVDAEAIRHARSSTEHRPERLDSDNRDHGRDANSPSEIPPLGWKDIGWRLWEEFNKDRVLLIAAGRHLLPAARAVSCAGGVRLALRICRRPDDGGRPCRLSRRPAADRRARSDPPAVAGVGAAGSQRARRRVLRRAGNRTVERQQRHQGALRRHEHCLWGNREAQLRKA